MDTVKLDEYLRSPCMASSLPYWKAQKTVIPDNMMIIRDDAFFKDKYTEYKDSPYFKLIHRLKHLEKHIEKPVFTEGDFDYDLSDDGDAAREEPEYLNVLNNPDFEVIYEQHGWEHAREVIGKFTVPDDGKEYMLLFTISKDKENPTAFANTALSVMLGANLKSRERTCQNSQKLGCNVTVSEDGQNHFWLLKRK